MPAALVKRPSVAPVASRGITGTPGYISLVSASIGATILRPGLLHDPERRFAEADSALYVAKAAGRNCLRLFGDPVEVAGDVAMVSVGEMHAV